MINFFLFCVKSVRSVSLIFSLKKPAFFQVFTLIFCHFETGLSKISGKSGSASPRLYIIMQFNVWGSKPSTRKKSMPLKSTHTSSEIEIVENCTFYLKWHNIWYTLTLNERSLYNKFILVFTCSHQQCSSNVRYIYKPHAASPLKN